MRSTTVEHTSPIGSTIRTVQCYRDWLRIDYSPKEHVHDGSTWGGVIDVVDIPVLMRVLLEALQTHNEKNPPTKKKAQVRA